RVEAGSAGLEKGSEFLVWLPVLPSGLPALAAAPEATPTVAADGRLKILLVEDHQDPAESLAAMLEGWGHEVQVAFDGLAALRAVAALAPDVVLSDLGLPSLDGYEFARRLRQQPGFGRVLLVALSGYGREEDKRRSLEAGFDHHLVKPPDMDVLQARLAGVAAASAEQGARALHCRPSPAGRAHGRAASAIGTAPGPRYYDGRDGRRLPRRPHPRLRPRRGRGPRGPGRRPGLQRRGAPPAARAGPPGGRALRPLPRARPLR